VGSTQGASKTPAPFSFMGGAPKFDRKFNPLTS
jgi:hypothetical protein